MNKQYKNSIQSDTQAYNEQIRIELMQARFREDMEKFEKQMDYLRAIPEVPPMIEARLKELRQTQSWLILQIGWTRKTHYYRINNSWFRPSEVNRIEAIFQAESERQKA
jgi:hypothetical protein